MEIEKDKRCILYCRVSSKEQEEKGYSLEAQEKLLTDYAERNDFIISKIFKISESASGKQIRKTFNEMLRHVKKRKINTILCEKIDRLTRNLKDGAVISDWVVTNPLREVHFVKENFIVSQNTRAHENLVWDMKVAIARFYTNNLSEEVKKGQKAKIASGWLPCGNKLGYKTIGEKGHKIHVPNEKIAPYIIKAFELYGSGNYSLKRLCDTLYQEGLRSKTDKKVTTSTLHKMISDPFYCGYLVWKGQEYDGKQEPLISEELFYIVQKNLTRKYKVGQIKKHFHTFKGMLTCVDCGSIISWETQKGRNYGKCSGYHPCSRKGFIKEEKLESKLDDLMAKIKPNNKAVLDWINKALKEKHNDKKDYSQNTRESLNLSLKKTENRLDRLYEDKLDGMISIEYYQKKFKEFNKSKKELFEEIGKLEKRVKNYYEIGVAIHELAFNAQKGYHSPKATFDDKRTLINNIFTDLMVNIDNTISIKYTPAFAFLEEWMPKLNATFELSKHRIVDNKTGSFEPAHPILLPRSDSNRRPID